MSKIKSYEQHFKETFTKTLGQRYEESTRTNKIAYWIFISIVFLIISAGGIYSTILYLN